MLRTLLKIRVRIQRLLRLSDTHSMLLWAIAAGVLGALATNTFRESLKGAQWLLVGHSGSLVEIAKTLSWQMRVLLPAAGGVVAGSILVVARRFASGATSDYMEAVTVGDGTVSIPQTLLRSLSSLCTIASGGSIGREGPMVQLAAMCASVIGHFTRVEPSRLRLLVACGAAAGITAAYNAPIAGAFFVSEIVLGAIVMESFGPIVVASVVSNITMRAFPGYQPTYEMPVFPATSNMEVILFIGLGLLAGLAAPQFLRVLSVVKHQFHKSALPLPARLGVGGLMVGILSIWVPQVWGNGYCVVNSLLHAHWVWSAVLTMLACKLVATALTAGSGAVGGIFTPTLFMGAAVGYLFGQAMQALWPQMVSAPYAYAMVGMGAFLAASTGAPLMAILMIFEMTLSYQVMLPLILSCIVAYFIARSMDGASMYDVTIQRNLDEKNRLLLRQTQMKDLIKPTETVLPPTATLNEMIRLFLRHPVKYLYIVDDAHHFLGVVALQELTSALIDPLANTKKLAVDFLRKDFLQVITPDMSLDDGWQRFIVHQGERLPVVQNLENPIFLGVVYKSSLLDAYYRLGHPQASCSNL